MSGGVRVEDLADLATAGQVRAHVRHLVDDGDWCYARIARHVGTSRATVSRWTLGARPNRAHAAAVLAMTVDTPKPPGRNQPGRGPTLVTFTCQGCGAPSRAPFRAARSRRYCGHVCAARHRAWPNTTVRDAEIVRLYRENARISEVTAATGVVVATIYRVLARAGVPRNRPRGRRPRDG